VVRGGWCGRIVVTGGWCSWCVVREGHWALVG
jgi:hypothetical protein